MFLRPVIRVTGLFLWGFAVHEDKENRPRGLAFSFRMAIELFTLVGMLAVAIAIPIRQDAKIDRQDTEIRSLRESQAREVLSLKSTHEKDVADMKIARREDLDRADQQRKEMLEQFKVMNEKLDRLILAESKR